MMDPIKTYLSRAESSLMEDAFGLVALIVILVGGLHLPSLI